MTGFLLRRSRAVVHPSALPLLADGLPSHRWPPSDGQQGHLWQQLWPRRFAPLCAGSTASYSDSSGSWLRLGWTATSPIREEIPSASVSESLWLFSFCSPFHPGLLSHLRLCRRPCLFHSVPLLLQALRPVQGLPHRLQWPALNVSTLSCLPPLLRPLANRQGQP